MLVFAGFLEGGSGFSLFLIGFGGGETVISVMSGLLETCWLRFKFTGKTVDTTGNVAHKWGPRIT